MSNANRKFFIAYLVLVVVPLGGLGVILTYGQRLKAPTYLDGVWNVAVHHTASDSFQCQELMNLERDETLAIVQSGNNISLDLGKDLAGSGLFEGATLKASLTISGPCLRGAAGCGENGGLLLKAIVTPGAEPRTILGTIIRKDRASCAPLRFVAVKRVSAEGTKDQ